MSDAQLRADVARAITTDTATAPTPPPNFDPYLDEMLWGVPPIAAEINKGYGATHHMIRSGMLDGAVTKVGGRYVSTRRRLRDLLTGANGPSVPATRECVPAKPLTEAAKRSRRAARNRNAKAAG